MFVIILLFYSCFNKLVLHLFIIIFICYLGGGHLSDPERGEGGFEAGDYRKRGT